LVESLLATPHVYNSGNCRTLPSFSIVINLLLLFEGTGFIMTSMSTSRLEQQTGGDLADEKQPSTENVENCAVITTIENFQVLGLSSANATFYASFSAERKKRLMRKVKISNTLDLKEAKNTFIAG
jgi:hypothetical protein